MEKALKPLAKEGLDKSEFLYKEVLFLGHNATLNGIEPNPKKS